MRRDASRDSCWDAGRILTGLFFSAGMVCAGMRCGTFFFFADTLLWCVQGCGMVPLAIDTPTGATLPGSIYRTIYWQSYSRWSYSGSVQSVPLSTELWRTVGLSDNLQMVLVFRVRVELILCTWYVPVFFFFQSSGGWVKIKIGNDKA